MLKKRRFFYMQFIILFRVKSMQTKMKVIKLAEDEIKNFGLEKNLINITFKSKKKSLEENYASCIPNIVSGIQKGYILNFDLKMINKQKLCDNHLQGLIVHELFHLVINEMRYIFSGEKHRKKTAIKNLNPKNSIYTNGRFAYCKIDDFEEILAEYLTFEYCLYRKDGGFIMNIKHRGYKNIFTYLEHQIKELTKDIREQIKNWKWDFERELVD